MMNLLPFAPVQTELGNIQKRVENSRKVKTARPAPLLLTKDFLIKSEPPFQSKTKSLFMQDVQSVAMRFSFWANATIIGAAAIGIASMIEPPKNNTEPVAYQLKQDSNNSLRHTAGSTPRP